MALPSARPRRRQARSAADLFAFKANFRGAVLAEGLLPVLSFDGGYGGMVVADGGWKARPSASIFPMVVLSSPR